MNQIKIGKFIAAKRKEKNLTQTELAEKLGITDRAVSKWETGKSLPDSSIMIDLCEILKISVNELFCGEDIEMEDYNMKTEELLLEMKHEKEEKDRQLLKMESVIVIVITIMFFALVATASYAPMDDWVRYLLIIVGFIAFVTTCLVLVKIEQVAGYYECKYCHHKYIPKYWAINIAMHIGRTRYLKCPKCGKKSWNKKVIED